MVEEAHHDKPVGALRWLPWLIGIAVFVWLYSAGPNAQPPQVSAPKKLETPAPKGADQPSGPAENSQEPNLTTR